MNYRMGGGRKWNFLGGILKGPGKPVGCVAWQLLESYPGALTSPGSPHCAQLNYTKCEEGKWEWISAAHTLWWIPSPMCQLKVNMFLADTSQVKSPIHKSSAKFKRCFSNQPIWDLRRMRNKAKVGVFRILLNAGVTHSSQGVKMSLVHLWEIR